MPEANLTGEVSWRPQYSGPISSPAAHVPVRFRAIGTLGGRWVIRPAASTRAGTAGATRDEWKACVVSRAIVSQPRCRNALSSALISASVPETVIRSGALYAATAAEPPCASTRRSSSATSVQPTATIRPLPGTAAKARPRAATSSRPSSGLNTPATQAAAYSPRLWPTTASGRTPHEAQNSASATWRRKTAGWSSSARACAAGSANTSSGPTPVRRRNSSACRSSAARNAGWSRWSSTAMPAYSELCPGKRNPIVGLPRPDSPASACPVPSRSHDSMRSAAACSESASTLSRCRSVRRPVWLVQARSVRAAPGSRSRLAHCPARDCSASALFALIVMSSGPGRRSVGVRSGACSSTAKALVPPIPRELTAARRGDPGRGSGCALTNRPDSSSFSRGLGAVKYGLGGIWPRCRASAALIRPAMPDAASMCPISAFTEPMAQGASWPNSFFSAAISVGSPSGTPVPCASM